MYLKQVALQNKINDLHKELDEKNHKLLLGIAIRDFNQLKYGNFWKYIRKAETYANRHNSKELLPIKLFQLAAALKTNQKKRVKQLKKELRLNCFNNELLSKIDFKIDNFSGLFPAFEKFLADIYLAFHDLPESYYQELRNSREKASAHSDKIYKLNQEASSYFYEISGLVRDHYPIEIYIQILCATAVLKVTEQFSVEDYLYDSSSNIDLRFSETLEKTFQKKANRLTIFYLEKGLSNISAEQTKSTLIERAKLIHKYEEIDDDQKIIEHGRILMKHREEKGHYNATILNASYIFVNLYWGIIGFYFYLNPLPKEEKQKIFSCIEDDLRLLLESYFEKYSIKYNENSDISDMYDLFEKEIKSMDWDYHECIDKYARLIC